MKLFNEEGTFVGEFIDASSEVIGGVKETVTDLADISIVLGIIGFILAPGVTAIIIGLILLLKIILFPIKLFINACWWLLRLPFTLIFHQRFPEF